MPVKTHLVSDRRTVEVVGQSRPKGTQHRASVEWKLRVRARVDGDQAVMTRAELARAASTTTASISQLLGREDAAPKESSSKLVPAINTALGLPQPTDGNPEQFVDDLHDRLTQAWPDLDATERAVLELIVARRTKPT